MQIPFLVLTSSFKSYDLNVRLLFKKIPYSAKNTPMLPLLEVKVLTSIFIKIFSLTLITLASLEILILFFAIVLPEKNVSKTGLNLHMKYHYR